MRIMDDEELPPPTGSGSSLGTAVVIVAGKPLFTFDGINFLFQVSLRLLRRVSPSFPSGYN